MIGTGIGLGLSGYRLKTGPSTIPESIGGLQLWLDGSDLTTLYQSSGGSLANSDGDPLGYWIDKSGNGKHATQLSGTNKPSVRLNVKNGLSVVRMDGVSSRLIESTLSLNAPYSIFCVAKRSGGDATGRLFHLGASQDQFLYLGTLGSDGYAWFNGNGTTWNSVANTTPSRTWGSGFHFFGGTNSSGTAVPYWDTYTQDSINGTTAQSTGYAFGYLPTLSSIQRFGGDICEFLIYGKLLASSEIGKLSGYLNDKWGVY
jgi:hypothetical protein